MMIYIMRANEAIEKEIMLEKWKEVVVDMNRWNLGNNIDRNIGRTD